VTGEELQYPAMNDLSKTNSDRAKKLQAMWQACAERANIIPSPNNKKSTKAITTRIESVSTTRF